MFTAKNEQGDKVKASPNTRALCVYCDAVMIAKCGEINRWHWAHEIYSRCDPWASGETEWHLEWKSLFPLNWVEIPIIKEEKHIADVKTDKGVVIEFQNSPISPAEIRKRERFYANMVWVFNVQNASIAIFKKGDYFTLKWRWPWQSIIRANCPLYLDVGNYEIAIKEERKTYIDADTQDFLYSNYKITGHILKKDCLFEVKAFYRDGRSGWGWVVDRKEFIQKFS